MNRPYQHTVDASPALKASSTAIEWDILLIEDSPSQALQFQLLLQRSGYTIIVSPNGADGWCQAYTKPPRLILLDIDLPGLDGFQVLSRLKRGRQTKHIPVIMLTHRDHVSNVMRAIDLGADGYLFKDDAADHLCAAAAQFLQTIQER